LKTRVTNDKITNPSENQVFVFGSNEAGRHGAGAARDALSWGAVWGIAEGLQGRTYGIPTKDESVWRVLTVDEIKHYVDRFIEFARSRPDLTFLVTEIGCGLAGYEPEQIAPLFKEAESIENVHLPQKFWNEIRPNENDRN